MLSTRTHTPISCLIQHPSSNIRKQREGQTECICGISGVLETAIQTKPSAVGASFTTTWIPSTSDLKSRKSGQSHFRQEAEPKCRTLRNLHVRQQSPLPADERLCFRRENVGGFVEDNDGNASGGVTSLCDSSILAKKDGPSRAVRKNNLHC